MVIAGKTRLKWVYHSSLISFIIVCFVLRSVSNCPCSKFPHDIQVNTTHNTHARGQEYTPNIDRCVGIEFISITLATFYNRCSSLEAVRVQTID